MTTLESHGIHIGNRRGVEIKTTCPQCSPTRKKKNQPCLNVNTDLGVWHCWHCDWSGGLSKGEYKKVSKVEYIKPSYKIDKPNTGIVDWFNKRCISETVIERNKITRVVEWMPQTQREEACIAFPYYRGDEVVNVKYRDKDKNFKLSKGAERILYGLNDLAETTVICEGEIDKLSLDEAGITNSVSVPDGAPAENTQNFGSKFDYLSDPILETVQKWIIAVDNDGPGKRLQEELIRRFGAEKCSVVQFPEGCKDANDVLKTHGKAVLSDLIASAIPVPISGTFIASEVAGELLDMYGEGLSRGVFCGWKDLDEFYTCMPGQLNIVTGIPGHGKSEFVDALCVQLAHFHGWRTAFYSPENYPVKLHVAKLAEKYVGRPFNSGPVERMSEYELSRAMAWIDGHFRWIMPEQPSLDEILDKARSLVARDGIRVLVIDPWNEVEHSRPSGMSETEYISVALSQIRRFARKHDVAVFVVAHPQKLIKDKDGFYPVPNPYDISGSANWRNKADNCFAVWRNLADDRYPVEIHIQKIKFKICGKIGKVDLTYDKLTGIYRDSYKSAAPLYDKREVVS